jgi:hypothetical protein
MALSEEFFIQIKIRILKIFSSSFFTTEKTLSGKRKWKKKKRKGVKIVDNGEKKVQINESTMRLSFFL